jgi:hypothetical protein
LSIPFHKRFQNRPQSLTCDLTVPYICFPPFECLSTCHSSGVLETQLTVVLPDGSWVTCHSFPTLRLCFGRFSRTGRALLSSEGIILLVDSGYNKL